ncbi:hypothetical protein PHLCEN_2v5359 [Hermanssonia centrifuga]|uniref:Uncharacterized protein n=1 Tax=Hermanssonia centrifuga TaxID=98765 RepID=A0A2R6P5G1_9APHY|nr:hypothetical protein PHLCEN_2v5359 [Hermanssonia centrifuga]
MSTQSKDRSRKWCHCGVLCRVPRQVSRTTFWQHAKLARSQQVASNTAAAEESTEPVAGPSKRAHLDHTAHETEDEGMTQVSEELPSLVPGEIVMPPPLRGPDIEDIYGSAADELEAVSSVFPHPVPTVSSMFARPVPTHPAVTSPDEERLDVGFDGDVWDYETNQTCPLPLPLWLGIRHMTW